MANSYWLPMPGGAERLDLTPLITGDPDSRVQACPGKGIRRRCTPVPLSNFIPWPHSIVWTLSTSPCKALTFTV